MTDGTDDEIRSRVRKLEEWRQGQETRIAVEKEQRRHMDERFDRLEKDVSTGFKEIKGAFWKVLWAVSAIFIAGVMNWILKGGLGG